MYKADEDLIKFFNNEDNYNMILSLFDRCCKTKEGIERERIEEIKSEIETTDLKLLILKTDGLPDISLVGLLDSCNVVQGRGIVQQRFLKMCKEKGVILGNGPAVMLLSKYWEGLNSPDVRNLETLKGELLKSVKVMKKNPHYFSIC